LICFVEKIIFDFFDFGAPLTKNVPPGPKLEDSIVDILPFLKLGNFKIAITRRAFVHFG
jgi:hypothetical protein